MLRPEEAEKAGRAKRESVRREFRRELAKLVAELEDCETVRIAISGKKKAGRRDDASANQELPDHLIINDHVVPIPEAMEVLIEDTTSKNESILAWFREPGFQEQIHAQKYRNTA